MNDQGCRGVSLGGTLLAVSVLSLLAFTLASLCVTHLRIAGQQDRGMLAANAARSVASAAIARLIKQPEFGKEGLAEHLIKIEMDEARGLVSFNEELATEAEIPFSTNNLKGNADASGANGQIVPSGTVHIWALGESGGTRRRIEVILRVPPFPWAIASGSKVVTHDRVVVGAIPAGVWPPPESIDDLLPADVVANDSGLSIVLGDNSTVLGDVETPGQVQKGAGAHIRGALHLGSAPADLPKLKPEDFKPKGDDVYLLTQDEIPSQIAGSARSDTDLTFDQPLELQSARLYVAGNLALNGGVKGTGMIVASGDITIRERLNVDGFTEIGVVSGGSVRLTGQSPETSMLRGLFYAERDLSAEHLTLVGSLITGNAATGVDLKHTTVLYQEPAILTTPAGSDTTIRTGPMMFGRGNPVDDAPFGIAISAEVFDYDPSWGGWEERPLFLFTVDAAAGGRFPITVNVSPALLPIPSRSQVLNNVNDVDTFVTRLVTDVRIAIRDYGHNQRYNIDTLYATTFFNAMGGVLRSSFGGTSGSTTTTTLPGPNPGAVDISKFLPLEDRIRIVSWLER